MQTLVAAIDAVGFKPVLNDPKFRGTVFAPTNEAFDKLFKALNTTAAGVLAQPNLVKAVLSYHVVPKEVFTRRGPNKVLDLTTLLKQRVTVAVPRGNAKMRVYYGAQKLQEKALAYAGSANVVVPDVRANRAIVQVIDEVLVPTLPKSG